jgi:hypothetical protein
MKDACRRHRRFAATLCTRCSQPQASLSTFTQIFCAQKRPTMYPILGMGGIGDIPQRKTALRLSSRGTQRRGIARAQTEMPCLRDEEVALPGNSSPPARNDRARNDKDVALRDGAPGRAARQPLRRRRRPLLALDQTQHGAERDRAERRAREFVDLGEDTVERVLDRRRAGFARAGFDRALDVLEELITSISVTRCGLAAKR